MQSLPSHTNCLKPSYTDHPPASPFHYCRDAHTLLVRSRQQTWNNEHEATSDDDGNRRCSRVNSFFKHFHGLFSCLSQGLGMPRNGSFGSPLFSPSWDQLRCCHLSVLRPFGGRFSDILGSTCDTGLPLLGLPTQLHTVTVGHNTTHTQIDTARTGCLNHP